MPISIEMLKAVEALEKAASITVKRARSTSETSSADRLESAKMYAKVEAILKGVVDVGLPTGVKLIKAPKTALGAVATVGEVLGAPILPARHATEIMSKMSHGAGLGGYTLGLVTNILKFKDALNSADDALARNKIVKEMYEQMKQVVADTVDRYIKDPHLVAGMVGTRIDTYLNCNKEEVRRTVTNFLEGRERFTPDLTDCEIAVLIGRLNPTGRHEGMYSVEAAEGASYLSEKGPGGWAFSGFRDLTGAFKSLSSPYDRREDPKLIVRLNKVLEERQKLRDERILQIPEGEERQAELIKRDIHKLLVQQHMQLSTFNRLIRHSGRDVSREDAKAMLAICGFGICTTGVVASAVLTAGIAPAGMLALLTSVSAISASVSGAEYATERVGATGGGQPTLEDLKGKGFEGIAESLHGGKYVYESVLSLDPEILNILHVLTALHTQLQASPLEAHTDLKISLEVLTKELNKLMDNYYSTDSDLTLGANVYRLTKDLTPRVEELKRQIISRLGISEESLMPSKPTQRQIVEDIHKMAKALYAEYKRDESRIDARQEAIDLIKTVPITKMEEFTCQWEAGRKGPELKARFLRNPAQMRPNCIYLFADGSYLFKTHDGGKLARGSWRTEGSAEMPSDEKIKEMIAHSNAIGELESLTGYHMSTRIPLDKTITTGAPVLVTPTLVPQAPSPSVPPGIINDDAQTDAGSEDSIFDPLEDLISPGSKEEEAQEQVRIIRWNSDTGSYRLEGYVSASLAEELNFIPVISWELDSIKTYIADILSKPAIEKLKQTGALRPAPDHEQASTRPKKR